MESLGNRESQLQWEQSIQKIRDYLNSLSFERGKKKVRKVLDETTGEISEVMNQDSEDDNLNPSEEDSTQQPDNLPDNDEQDAGDGDNLDDMENDSENEGGSGGQSGGPGDKEKKQEFEIPPEDRDEYIPRDSEFGEAMGESSRFAEVYPPFLGYYVQGKKSYFDRETNLWSKRKNLTPFSHKLPEGIDTYTYTGVITAGVNAIPLPDGAWPDTSSLHAQGRFMPEFQVDQNGCIYLVSREKQFVSFNFGLKQHFSKTPPIMQDSERIVFDALSKDTQELLDNLKNSGGTTMQKVAAIKYYILKNKKYSTKVQGTLRNKSNRNNYIKHLDESPILECFSANSLFVALCRELGIPARLVVGHMIQSVNPEGKACITKNDGHAWSEIWDETTGTWMRVDSTPTEKEDGKKSNENGQEQNNNQDADNNFGDDQSQQSGEGGEKSQGDSKKDSESKSDKDGEKGKEGEKNDTQKDSKSDNNSNDGKKESSDSEQKSDKDSESSDNNSKSENEQANDSQSESQERSDSDKSKDHSSQNSKGELIKPQDKKPSKSPEKLLDEMIEKAKKDNLMHQKDQMKDVLDQLEKATTKEEIKDILDKSGLSDFAKDMVDKLGENKILEEEKKALESLDDERKIDEFIKNSLLNDEFKQKLKNYADIMKKKIEEEKKRMKSEMEKLGFTPQEFGYYREYKQLEAEVEPEVRRQIRELQKILPVQYQIVKDESQTYRSGPMLDGSKLTEFVVTGDPLVFKRNKESRESNEINMFETIIIDTSGSMGDFDTPGSILRESVKAAIIRAKVLEHFKVDFSIILFGDYIDEVMSFDEKFSSKGKCLIPSKLIRAAHRSGGNSREPISYVYQNMLKQFKKNRGKSFGNISFIGDGDLYSGQERTDLKAMIEDLKHRGFGVTAYYVNNRRSRLIDYYFGKPEDGGAVYAGSSIQLSKEIIEAHKTHLKKKIKKYMK